jgi:DNA mismatch repair ATPase MutS
MLAAQPYMPLAISYRGRTRLVLALENWRQRHGAALVSWLAALGKVEALNALAAYAYENPSDPYPEFMDAGPCFEANELGHPLLPAAQCVRNDVRLDRDVRLLIVSGSNMSGKSTLLRAVGANAVLAFTGAPVRAVRLRLASLTLGATLCIQDSLLEGTSRFFAEVSRIRQLLDLAQARPPLLFLLDELFSGTNSEDRRRGAEAVVSGLVGSGAIGLMTTHDLALTRLAEGPDVRAVNVHFTDQWTDGVMVFDYRMRKGILPSGNGLALMRAVGIEI